MFSDLPDDTIIVLVWNGEQEVFKLVTGTVRERFKAYDIATGVRGITGVGRELLPGETVYRCVTKGAHLEVRRTYVLKPGDVEWRDMGLVSTFPGPNLGKPVFKNYLKKRI